VSVDGFGNLESFTMLAKFLGRFKLSTLVLKTSSGRKTKAF